MIPRSMWNDLQEQRKAEFIERVRREARLANAHLPRKARRRAVKEAIDRALKRGDYL